MSDTKTCNLTENEIRYLIAWLGSGLYTHEEPDAKIERINYLNRRLKAFKEPEVKVPDAADAKSNSVATQAQGWPVNGN